MSTVEQPEPLHTWIGAMVIGKLVTVNLSLGVMLQSSYRRQALENPLESNPDESLMTLRLVMEDENAGEAMAKMQEELEEGWRIRTGGKSTYLDIGMALGKANEVGEKGHILLPHEGKLLPHIHGRSTMTTFTGRLLDRAMRYGLCREGTEVISRTGRRDVSPRNERREFTSVSVRTSDWDQAVELTGVNDSRTLGKLLQMLDKTETAGG